MIYSPKTFDDFTEMDRVILGLWGINAPLNEKVIKFLDFLCENFDNVHLNILIFTICTDCTDAPSFTRQI
jgi:hypothetical protein